MAEMKVNVDRVHSAAIRIKGLNDQMRDDFADVQKAISKLDGSWDGSAATNTISKFNSIKSSYCNARYKVVDNFVAFLHQQIGEGYAQTEDANKSLADAFK